MVLSAICFRGPDSALPDGFPILIFSGCQYLCIMPDFRVTLEAAWIVRDVGTAADAVGIAVSECGKRLMPSAKFVDVDVLNSPCPHCGKEITTATVAARTALAGLLLSMKVFDANSAEHAEKIAKRVIGNALRDIPLSLFEVEELEEEPDAGKGRT